MPDNSSGQSSGKTLRPPSYNFNSFVIIFAFIVIAALMTYLVPAGQYTRQADENGNDIVLADSFTYTQQNTPVGLMGIFSGIGEAFISASDIIFCILFAYCFVGMLLDCGSIDLIFSRIIRLLGKRSGFIIPVVSLCFGIMGSVAGMAEETFGLFPVCISLAVALGYDSIVGAAISYLAVFTGFASATFNPYTIGVAQATAGVTLYSGLAFRAVCFVLFMGILIAYTCVYASRIKKDPRKSLVYTLENDTGNRTDINGEFTFEKLLCLVVFAGIVAFSVIGALCCGWYLKEIIGLYIMGCILVGIINRWPAGDIADKLVLHGGGAMFSMLIIGFSNAINLVLTKGGITDSIVHTLAGLLEGTSGYVSAFMMLLIQNLLNFFIPSGPGQAAVTMPIMASFADITGLSRQIAVLAFQFGDGLSNIFWPTMVFMMCGIIQIPVGKWYRFIAPLFAIMLIAQTLMLFAAVSIGYC